MAVKEYRITEMLYDKCQKVVVKQNAWVCRCPICGDSKTKSNVRRFYVDFYQIYDTYVYKCHRCGDSGNVYTLYSKLYDVSYKEAKDKLDDIKYDADSIKNRLLVHESNDESSVDTELDINLKTDCYGVNDTPTTNAGIRLVRKLKDFIADRRINNAFIAHSGRYKSRIIIPVINNNKLVYFQGRTLYDDIGPKYLNPSVEKTPIIFNSDVIVRDRDIIIVEGLIDAMSVGSQCTSTLGADFSDDKLEILFGMTNHTVIICADNDEAGITSIKRVLKKSIYKKVLKYFLMPKHLSHIKDMNKLLVSDIVDNIEKFIIDNSFSYFYTKNIIKLK